MDICTFGEHLTIDGYGGDFELLSDRVRVQHCLRELPQLLGMRPLAPAMVRWAEPNDFKDPGGWSGYVLIAESHISIHTFPHRRFLSADVYTCREGTDVDKVIQYFTGLFGLTDTDTCFFKRGTKYPVHNLMPALTRQAAQAQ
ncbi:MAG: S-adenosylmethionine decarboxylase [Gammaproteobacteria bacterium]|nr:S-adenosylmethionine decarboxylase [Gammaproteobacteria bacterium]